MLCAFAVDVDEELLLLLLDGGLRRCLRGAGLGCSFAFFALGNFPWQIQK